MRNHFDLPLRYELIEGDQELAPGVQVMTTHGQTPGHQSLLVYLQTGARIVLCADAAYAYDTIHHHLDSDHIPVA